MGASTQVNRRPRAQAPGTVSADASVLRALLEGAIGGTLPEWAMVQAALARCEVAPGGTVFAQDVEHPFVYAVRSGLLKLCYLGEDGSEWVKSFAHEGRFFASIAALDDAREGTPAVAPAVRTSFAVVALEHCVLERIDYRLLTRLAERHLPWARALLAMTIVFARRKEQRERELLTLNAEQRYLAFRETSPGLEARLPQKDLARFLGITPVGLNRIVMRVRRRGPG